MYAFSTLEAEARGSFEFQASQGLDTFRLYVAREHTDPLWHSNTWVNNHSITTTVSNTQRILHVPWLHTDTEWTEASMSTHTRTRAVTATTCPPRFLWHTQIHKQSRLASVIWVRGQSPVGVHDPKCAHLQPLPPQPPSVTPRSWGTPERAARTMKRVESASGQASVGPWVPGLTHHTVAGVEDVRGESCEVRER